jgi:hypothetical protein
MTDISFPVFHQGKTLSCQVFKLEICRSSGEDLIDPEFEASIYDLYTVESIYNAYKFALTSFYSDAHKFKLTLSPESLSILKNTGGKIRGESLSLPIVLGLFYCFINKPWPGKWMATGAIQLNKNKFMCGPVGGIVPKIEKCLDLGFTDIYLPAMNMHEVDRSKYKSISFHSISCDLKEFSKPINIKKNYIL